MNPNSISQTLQNIDLKFNTFLREIAAAQSAKAYNTANHAAQADFIPRKEYVEADRETIDQILPMGLGKDKFIMFQDVMVCLPGTYADIIADGQRSAHE